MPDVRLVVAGDQIEPAEPYQELARELGVADRIDWRLRFVTEDEIADVMEEAAVVVLPYREIESSGVLATALGHGRPVVVTDVGSLGDTVREFDAGAVVPPEDPAALADACVAQLRDPALPDRAISSPGSTRQRPTSASTPSSFDDAGDPLSALAVGAALIVLLEIGRVEAGRDYAWLIAEAAVAAAALFIAWRGQERLRLVPLLILAAGYHLALVWSHMAADIPVDFDVSIFASQGQSLLDGDYPRSEYPTGAVSLFALETWLGDDSARTPNALLMIPFQLAAVAAIWSLRTRWSAWLAALVALWPLNLYAWEFKFDLAPAALLAVGLALAYRERFGLGGHRRSASARR